MIINMVGGGGGAALNFKVVPGLTQPGTASENTIWVKTEQIGAWYFSATQPEGLQEWDVWFRTGTESVVEFNALRKNGLKVYPLSAKQMVSGALVDVGAKSYQDGKWESWISYLFNNGDQCVDITGGWTGHTYSSGSRTFVPGTINSSGQLQLDSNGSTACEELYTKNKISKGSFNRLYFNVAVATGTGCVMLNTEQGHLSATAVGIRETNTAGTYNIDLTGAEDFYVVTYNATSGTFRVDQIWMA